MSVSPTFRLTDEYKELWIVLLKLTLACDLQHFTQLQLELVLAQLGSFIKLKSIVVQGNEVPQRPRGGRPSNAERYSELARKALTRYQNHLNELIIRANTDASENNDQQAEDEMSTETSFNLES